MCVNSVRIESLRTHDTHVKRGKKYDRKSEYNENRRNEQQHHKRNSTTKCRSNRPADQKADSGMARRQSISGVVKLHEIQSHGAGKHSYRGRKRI